MFSIYFFDKNKSVLFLSPNCSSEEIMNLTKMLLGQVSDQGAANQALFFSTTTAEQAVRLNSEKVSRRKANVSPVQRNTSLRSGVVLKSQTVWKISFF